MIRAFTCILLLFFITACKKDRKIDPEQPDEAKLTGLLKSVTLWSATGEIKMDYSYVDSVTLKSVRYTRGGTSTLQTFTYENDTLRSSQMGDTLIKYVHLYGKLQRIEKHIPANPNTYFVYYYDYNSAQKVRRITKRSITPPDLSGKYLCEFTINWREENIIMFREYFSNGLMEEYDFQYGEPRSPFTRLYAETLRVPSEDPLALSYNSPTGYVAFVAGMKYKIEGKYLENRLPLSQTISEFDIQQGGDWKMIQQYTFEYYE